MRKLFHHAKEGEKMSQSFFAIKYHDGGYGSFFKLSFFPFSKLGLVYEMSAVYNNSARMGIEIILLQNDD